MTVSYVTSGEAYSNNLTSLVSTSFNVNAGDLIAVLSWMDVSGATISDSASQAGWQNVDIANDSGRFLRLHYLLSSGAQTGLTLTLAWGGTNHFGGMTWIAERTDTGTWSFDKVAGVAGAFNVNPVTIASFDTTGPGVIAGGVVDYYSDVSETLDVGGSFTRRSFTTGAAGVGAMASFDFITGSAQTGVNPSCTATSPGGSIAIGFGLGSFVVTGGGGGGGTALEESGYYCNESITNPVVVSVWN